MNNKIISALVVILIAAVSFFAIQNYRLNKKVEELSATKNEVKITPVIPEQKPSNPPGASPFDKPSVDPLANQFPEETPGPAELTTIHFEKLNHDFGRINEDAQVSTVFKFTNTGKLPLLISTAQASCGCTVPQWPKNTIKPGETGAISVQFDSHDKSGQVDKTVTVVANTHPKETVLTIKATIIPKDK